MTRKFKIQNLDGLSPVSFGRFPVFWRITKRGKRDYKTGQVLQNGAKITKRGSTHVRVNFDMSE